MIVKGIEELLLCEARDARVLNQCVGDIVCRHAVEQEFVVSRVLRLVFRPFEVIADEVPESIADQRIKVEQVDNIRELFFLLSICVQEVH